MYAGGSRDLSAFFIYKAFNHHFHFKGISNPLLRSRLRATQPILPSCRYQKEPTHLFKLLSPLVISRQHIPTLYDPVYILTMGHQVQTHIVSSAFYPLLIITLDKITPHRLYALLLTIKQHTIGSMSIAPLNEARFNDAFECFSIWSIC